VLLLIACGVAVRLLQIISAQGLLIDDAYITLRYARNLMLGRGMVYNPGEPILGAPPLYVLLTGLLWKLDQLLLGPAGERIGYLVTAFNLALMVVVAGMLGRHLRDRLGQLGLLPVLLYALYLPFTDNTTAGMETTLLLFLLVASLPLLARGRLVAASIVMGLSVLVRPEGLLWIAAVIVTRRRRGEGNWGRLLGPLVAIGLAWGVFAWLYFGTPVPHNAAAKSGWNVSLWGREGLLPYVWTLFRQQTLLPRGVAATSSLWLDLLVAAEALVVAGLFAVGLRRLWRRRSLDLVWGLFFLAHLLFFIAGRGALEPSWYNIPPGLSVIIVVSYGLAALLPWRWREWPAARRAALGRVILLGALALVVAAGSLRAWVRIRGKYYGQMETGYGRTGRFLAREAVGKRSLVNEIGYIGYLADHYIYDMAGIITDEILKMRKANPADIDVPELAEHFAPDFIVVTRGRKRADLVEAMGAGRGPRYRLVLSAPPCYTFERSGSEDANDSRVLLGD